MLTQPQLEASETVANAAMNRSRGLLGVNSYQRELRLDIVAWLKERHALNPGAKWLDLCCGEGRALEEASETLAEIPGFRAEEQIVGVDLIEPRERPSGFRFVRASLHDWEPPDRFDLITCVHGLHYIGDRLGLIERIATWLNPGGLFVANFDASDIRDAQAAPLTRRLAGPFRRHGLVYNRRQHLIRLEAPREREREREIDFGLRFLGAKDDVGPNYTGQEGVWSVYEEVSGESTRR